MLPWRQTPYLRGALAPSLPYNVPIPDIDYRQCWDKALATNPKKYAKVLLLRFANGTCDLDTEAEVNQLISTFEDSLHYQTFTKLLDPTNKTRLHLQFQKHLADFAYDHDDPDSLLLVYYAGHGIPGRDYHGELQIRNG